MKEAGAQVDLIGGFRSKDIVILEEEMGRAATDLYICTDDGSYGYHGFCHRQAGGTDPGRGPV